MLWLKKAIKTPCKEMMAKVTQSFMLVACISLTMHGQTLQATQRAELYVLRYYSIVRL